MCILPHTQIWQRTMLIFFKVCLCGKISCQPLYRFQKIGGKFYWSRTYKNLGPLVWSKDLQDSSKDPEGSSMYYTSLSSFSFMHTMKVGQLVLCFEKIKEHGLQIFLPSQGWLSESRWKVPKAWGKGRANIYLGNVSAQTTWGILNN